MKTLFSTLFVCISLIICACSDSTSYRYVWAKNGLNLRAAPGTDQKIIGALYFGDSVRIRKETDISYNIAAIKNVDSTYASPYRYERVAPYILYGKWVEVETTTGLVGYVIDTYLLKVRSYPDLEDDFFLRRIKKDTVEEKNGDYTIKYERRIFENGIEAHYRVSRKVYDETLYFPNFSIREAFVVMTCGYYFGELVVVTKNWKEQLRFHDSELCSIYIEQVGDHVRVSIACSC